MRNHVTSSQPVLIHKASHRQPLVVESAVRAVVVHISLLRFVHAAAANGGGTRPCRQRTGGRRAAQSFLLLTPLSLKAGACSGSIGSGAGSSSSQQQRRQPAGPARDVSGSGSTRRKTPPWEEF